MIMLLCRGKRSLIPIHSDFTQSLLDTRNRGSFSVDFVVYPLIFTSMIFPETACSLIFAAYPWIHSEYGSTPGMESPKIATEISVSAENGYDHISLAVDSVPEIMKKIKAYPVTPINDHWFSLPNGTKIELKLLSDWKLNEG